MVVCPLNPIDPHGLMGNVAARWPLRKIGICATQFLAVHTYRMVVGFQRADQILADDVAAGIGEMVVAAMRSIAVGEGMVHRIGRHKRLTFSICRNETTNIRRAMQELARVSQMRHRMGVHVHEARKLLALAFAVMIKKKQPADLESHSDSLIDGDLPFRRLGTEGEATCAFNSDLVFSKLIDSKWIGVVSLAEIHLFGSSPLEKESFMKSSSILFLIVLISLGISGKKLDYAKFKATQDYIPFRYLKMLSPTRRPCSFFRMQTMKFVCAGTIATLKESGWEVHLLTLTQGQASCESHSKKGMGKRRCGTSSWTKQRFWTLPNNTWENVMRDSIVFWYDHQDSVDHIIERAIQKYKPSVLFTYDTALGASWASRT